ncbi:uncharacterized protein [Antedon mediterranea]|uniref:uncharacterized protein n=1 Tax=Antedon mediterranea TaxID=105859 RepID=UPI003AF8A742
MWLTSFTNKTKTTLRIRRLYLSGKKNIHKVYLRCHHNTFPRNSLANEKSGSKNTDCPASMVITVKREVTNRKSRSSDTHLHNFPMMVHLSYNHNHPILCADTLRHRDVSDIVTKKFVDMFKTGHSPSTALLAHKHDLEEEHTDDYVVVAADRAECPDQQWCYRLYYKIFKESYGEPDGEAMLRDLEAKIQQVCSTHNEEVAKIKRVGENVVVAICTPLMKRVHRYVRQSGELAFIDSSGGVDRHGCRVFVILTHSCAGGLPLGLLITTSETEEVITEGLTLLKDILPPVAFYGKLGPAVFMTDDCEAERKALSNVFPGSSRVLCAFHILQAMWRYLWDTKHRVKKEDRPRLLGAVKAMLYASTEAQLHVFYEDLVGDDSSKTYPQFIDHVTKLYDRREMWALCYRNELPMRSNNTNNYCEAAMRILKDHIFQRTKAFNMVQLFDFLLTRVEVHYERRLIDVANNRLGKAISARYASVSGWQLLKEDIIQTGDNSFEVPSQNSEGVTYNVNIEAASCSCVVGRNGGPCKHQHIVSKHYGIHTINTSPVNSPTLRRMFYTIATGYEMHKDWFLSLKSNESEESHIQCIAMHHEQAHSSTDVEAHPSTDIDTLSLTDMDAHPSTDENTHPSTDENTHTSTDENTHPLTTVDEMPVQQGQHDEQALLFIHLLKEKEQQHPDIFRDAISCFFDSVNKIKTDAALVSALHTFGKYSGESLMKKRPRRLGKIIGVQPTAVARRKSSLGGRRSLGSGRPLKQIQVNSNPKLMPKKKIRRAPHKLSTCVKTNISLGKTHSMKK